MTHILNRLKCFFPAGCGESQQPGSYTSYQQQVGRGRTVVQERASIAAGRRDHVGQSPETQKRPSPSAHGQMIDIPDLSNYIGTMYNNCTYT